MAIVLYGTGNTHTCQGVLCAIKTIKAEHFCGLPDDGWFLSPQEVYADIKPADKERPEVEASVETKVIDFDKMGNYEVRARAKALDIPGWKDARVKTLRNKLKA